MKSMRFSVFLFFLFISPSLVFAINYPPLTGRVVDQARVLYPATKETINQVLAQHETKTTNQIVVVVIESLEGLFEDEYAKNIGNKWGIGQKEKNNGVIILVAKRERKIRIQIGAGLKTILTNDMAKEIIDRGMTPYLRKGDYNTGIMQGVIAVTKILEEHEPVGLWQQIKSLIGELTGFLLVLILLPFYLLARILGYFNEETLESSGGNFDDSDGISGDF